MSASERVGWGKRYTGTQIDVYYDATRCAHVAACLRGSPAVFDTQRRPWVLPDAAAAEVVAEVVERCPTGALHYELANGQTEEAGTPDVTLATNGPILVRGNVTIHTANGRVSDTRVALCRCGHSGNKPFCDGEHRQIGFQAEGSQK